MKEFKKKFKKELNKEDIRKIDFTEEYRSREMDLKRLVLYFQKKIWLVIMLTVLGASAGDR